MLLSLCCNKSRAETRRVRKRKIFLTILDGVKPNIEVQMIWD